MCLLGHAIQSVVHACGSSSAGCMLCMLCPGTLCSAIMIGYTLPHVPQGVPLDLSQRRILPRLQPRASGAHLFKHAQHIPAQSARGPSMHIIMPWFHAFKACTARCSCLCVSSSSYSPFLTPTPSYPTNALLQNMANSKFIMDCALFYMVGPPSPLYPKSWPLLKGRQDEHFHAQCAIFRGHFPHALISKH